MNNICVYWHLHSFPCTKNTNQRDAFISLASRQIHSPSIGIPYIFCCLILFYFLRGREGVRLEPISEVKGQGITLYDIRSSQTNNKKVHKVLKRIAPIISLEKMKCATLRQTLLCGSRRHLCTQKHIYHRRFSMSNAASCLPNVLTEIRRLYFLWANWQSSAGLERLMEEIEEESGRKRSTDQCFVETSPRSKGHLWEHDKNTSAAWYRHTYRRGRMGNMEKKKSTTITAYIPKKLVQILHRLYTGQFMKYFISAEEKNEKCFIWFNTFISQLIVINHDYNWSWLIEMNSNS